MWLQVGVQGSPNAMRRVRELPSTYVLGRPAFFWMQLSPEATGTSLVQRCCAGIILCYKLFACCVTDSVLFGVEVQVQARFAASARHPPRVVCQTAGPAA